MGGKFGTVSMGPHLPNRTLLKRGTNKLSYYTRFIPHDKQTTKIWSTKHKIPDFWMALCTIHTHNTHTCVSVLEAKGWVRCVSLWIHFVLFEAQATNNKLVFQTCCDLTLRNTLIKQKDTAKTVVILCCNHRKWIMMRQTYKWWQNKSVFTVTKKMDEWTDNRVARSETPAHIQAILGILILKDITTDPPMIRVIQVNLCL